MLGGVGSWLTAAPSYTPIVKAFFYGISLLSVKVNQVTVPVDSSCVFFLFSVGFFLLLLLLLVLFFFFFSSFFFLLVFPLSPFRFH